LSYADLTGAELSEADLTGSIGLAEEQLADVITDEKTKLPEYLDREAGE
jgi:hypothetical protein